MRRSWKRVPTAGPVKQRSKRVWPMVRCRRGCSRSGGSIWCSTDNWWWRGGSGGDTLTRRAHWQSRCRQMHVKWMCGFQCTQLRQLLLQAPILLRQSLTASFQVFAIHLRLFQLCPVKNTPNYNSFLFPWLIYKKKKEKEMVEPQREDCSVNMWPTHTKVPHKRGRYILDGDKLQQWLLSLSKDNTRTK
jgi:hypothetical protein